MIENQRLLLNNQDTVPYLSYGYVSPLLNNAVQAGYQTVALKSLPGLTRPADYFWVSTIVRNLLAALVNTQAIGKIASEKCLRQVPVA